MASTNCPSVRFKLPHQIFHPTPQPQECDISDDVSDCSSQPSRFYDHHFYNWRPNRPYCSKENSSSMLTQATNTPHSDLSQYQLLPTRSTEYNSPATLHRDHDLDNGSCNSLPSSDSGSLPGHVLHETYSSERDFDQPNHDDLDHDSCFSLPLGNSCPSPTSMMCFDPMLHHYGPFSPTTPLSSRSYSSFLTVGSPALLSREPAPYDFGSSSLNISLPSPQLYGSPEEVSHCPEPLSPHNYGSFSPANSSASIFNCNVCSKTARDPVVTSCGHLYCWHCLYRWLNHHRCRGECRVCMRNLDDSSVTTITRGVNSGFKVYQDQSQGNCMRRMSRGSSFELLMQLATCLVLLTLVVTCSISL